jgi:hypothetical protein
MSILPQNAMLYQVAIKRVTFCLKSFASLRLCARQNSCLESNLVLLLRILISGKSSVGIAHTTKYSVTFFFLFGITFAHRITFPEQNLRKLLFIS